MRYIRISNQTRENIPEGLSYYPVTSAINDPKCALTRYMKSDRKHVGLLQNTVAISVLQ